MSKWETFYNDNNEEMAINIDLNSGTTKFFDFCIEYTTHLKGVLSNGITRTIYAECSIDSGCWHYVDWYFRYKGKKYYCNIVRA